MRTSELMLDGVPSFVITSMIAKQCDGLGVDYGMVVVEIKTPSKLWNKLRNKGDLGLLYLDVSNEVYGLNSNIPAYNPTVCGHEKRASCGIKTLRLIYYVDDLQMCKALGLECFEFKSGWSVKYRSYVDLMAPRKRPELKII